EPEPGAHHLHAVHRRVDHPASRFAHDSEGDHDHPDHHGRSAGAIHVQGDEYGQRDVDQCVGDRCADVPECCGEHECDLVPDHDPGSWRKHHVYGHLHGDPG